MIALSAVIAAIVVLIFCLVRVCLGPTLYDRVIAFNAGAYCLMLGVAALAVWRAQARALDVCMALLFSLVVLNLAFLKFSSAKTFQSAIAALEERS